MSRPYRRKHIAFQFAKIVKNFDIGGGSWQKRLKQDFSPFFPIEETVEQS